jgi:hypothetical protein
MVPFFGLKIRSCLSLTFVSIGLTVMVPFQNFKITSVKRRAVYGKCYHITIWSIMIFLMEASPSKMELHNSLLQCLKRRWVSKKVPRKLSTPLGMIRIHLLRYLSKSVGTPGALTRHFNGATAHLPPMILALALAPRPKLLHGTNEEASRSV